MLLINLIESFRIKIGIFLRPYLTLLDTFTNFNTRLEVDLVSYTFALSYKLEKTPFYAVDIEVVE
jgi:hypothetical protein